MSSLTVEKMLELQTELQDKYKHKWGGLSPKKGRDMLLWMLGEAGEVIDIIKKTSDEKIMTEADIRRHFVEELCDVMMYLHDVMLCYKITPEEMEQVYLEKHERNMKRW